MRTRTWLVVCVTACGGSSASNGPDAGDEREDAAAADPDAGIDAAAGCEDCVALVGGLLFDGADARPGTLVVRGDLIEAVLDPGAEHGAGRVVDVSGHTVLPGFFDLHVHTSDPAGPYGWFVADRFLQEHLAALLRAGVTTFMDLGNDRRIAFELRDRIRRGEIAGPDMLAVGSMITVTGGHPCYPGSPVGGVCLLVDSVEEVERVRTELLPYAPDALKIPLSASAGLPSLDPDALVEIVAAADATGVPVFTHVAGQLDVEQALDAGVKILAHIPMFEALSPALIDRLAAEGISVVPTLAVNESLYDLARGTDRYDDPGLEEDVPLEVLEALRAAPADTERRRDHMSSRREIAFENLARCFAAGVRVVTGTDSGIWGALHGHALHDEIILMVEHADATPAQALTAATEDAAAALGLVDRGRLAPGLLADLVVVAGNPLERIEDVRAITAVFRAGQEVDRDGLAIGGGASLVVTPIRDREAGDTCLFEGECAGDLVCDGWYARCVGVCQFPNSSGCTPGETACTPQNRCAPGDGCDLFGQDCENGASCSWIGNGATACWPAGQATHAEPCDLGAMCAPGHQCDFNTGDCYALCDPSAPESCEDEQSCADLEVFAQLEVGQCR
jgi:imidazolonepropionase-like amidohydrolase